MGSMLRLWLDLPSHVVKLLLLSTLILEPPEEFQSWLKKCKPELMLSAAFDRPAETLFRKMSSFLINKAVQQSTGVLMHDYGCMLRAYRRPIVEAMLQCQARTTLSGTCQQFCSIRHRNRSATTKSGLKAVRNMVYGNLSNMRLISFHKLYFELP